MADISQVKLLDGSTYNLKDSTARTVVKQTAKSDNKEYKILTTSSDSPTSGANAETAYDVDVTLNPEKNTITASEFIGNLKSSNIIPMISKTYPAYTCSADNGNKAVLFFGKVTITNSLWPEPWFIHYRLYVSTSETNTQGWYDCNFSINGSTVTYYNYNNFYNGDYRPIYHHRLIYPKSGYTSYGAFIGVRVQSARSVTTLARNFTIEILELKNCTIEIFDNIKRFDEVYVKTNNIAADTLWYNTDYNATSQGLQEYGDINDSAQYITSNGFRLTAGQTVKIWRYSLFGRLADGTYESFTTSSGTGTKAKNTHGFIPEGKIYWNSASGTDYSGVTNFTAYEQYHSIDYRYTFNIGTTGIPASSYTYLKWTYNISDGLLYLADEWFSTSLPSSEDGFIYQRIGSNYYNAADYRASLLLNNPYYIYKGSGIQIWVPQNVTITGGTNKITVSPAGASSYDVTVTPSITNNITGSGTSGYLAKFNGTNTITNGPQITSGGTGYLKQDGTWGTPAGTYSLPLAANGTRGGVQIGYSESGTNYAVKLSSEKAYVTVPWTDTKVNVVARGTTKAYLLADTTAPTSTAAAHTAVAETGVYLDTTAGKLVATSFSGNGSALTNLNGSNIASGTVAFARLPTTYWGNVATASTASYNTEPEVKSLKIGNGTTATMTKGIQLVYNSTLESLDFIFT